jgi:hypothetical protein
MTTKYSPVIRPAKTIGYRYKFWHQFPTLLPDSTDASVNGVAYFVQTSEEVE